MKTIHIMDMVNNSRLVFQVIVLSILFVGLAQAAPLVGPSYVPGDCVVTSTADSGPGSLRECISSLQSGATITFDASVFLPGNPATIMLTNALPNITTNNVTIDGSSAGVILDGSGTPEETSGVVINDASYVVIKGLQILNFPEDGIVLRNGASYNMIGGINGLPDGTCTGDCNLISGNGDIGVNIFDSTTVSNTVSGNYIGTDVNGQTAIGNGDDGVYIGDGGQHNFIGGSNANPGGTCSGECNLISGNGRNGVLIENSGTASNTVSGNYIGTDVSGTVALGNRDDDGVAIGKGASYNVIGGSTSAERNLISGNEGDGVDIWDSGTTNNIVSGNYIGTNISGTAVIGNAGQGVSIADGAQDNIIGGNNATAGGNCTGECNLISGNGRNGVALFASSGTTTMRNIISGNYIGTDANGMTGLGNSPAGAAFGSAVGGRVTYNIIGGDTPGERNLISGNSNHGVYIDGSNTMSNTVSGNYIGTNITGMVAIGNGYVGVGIADGANNNRIGGNNAIAFNNVHGVQVEGSDTLGNTITRNSIHSNGGQGIELVSGGNTELPPPVITAFDQNSGLASGAACANCTVEVFSDEADEGRVYEGTTTANGEGEWSLDISSAFTGPRLTATATDASGNTSEFGNQPPDCSGAEPSVETLWPPNHKFVAIDVLGITDPDGDPISITIDNIFQDEPVDTKGDGSFTPDGQGVGTTTADVRAERAGGGNGRVYHISFSADDGHGGICSVEVQVGVPHDKKDEPIDDGALFDSTVP